MKAIEYVISFPWLPQSREGKKVGLPSRSEIRRWLKKGSVIINGERPQPSDEIEFPIRELIFFPKGNRVTVIKEKSSYVIIE